MDKVTEAQAALGMITCEIVDCLGHYPKIVEDLLQKSQKDETQQFCEDIGKKLLNDLMRFREAAAALSSLVDEEGQLKRIKQLEAEIGSVDNEIENILKESNSCKERVNGEFEEATEQYLCCISQSKTEF